MFTRLSQNNLEEYNLFEKKCQFFGLDSCWFRTINVGMVFIVSKHPSLNQKYRMNATFQYWKYCNPSQPKNAFTFNVTRLNWKVVSHKYNSEFIRSWSLIGRPSLASITWWSHTMMPQSTNNQSTKTDKSICIYGQSPDGDFRVRSVI